MSDPGAARGVDPGNTRSFPLWAGVLAPPAAWGLQLVLGDLIFELGCGPAMRGRILGLGLHFWAVLQTSVLLGLTALAGVLAVRAYRSLAARSDGAVLERARSMAWVGVASATVYGLLIAYGFLPSLFLDACNPIP